MLSSGASRFALVGPGLSSPRTVPYRGLGVPLWETAGAAPTLDLNFAENRTLLDSVTGQNLVTFTRASAGTYVGSDGLIKTAAENVPRFDHDPVTGACLGLLVEEQRTNLLVRSGEFDDPRWNKVLGSITVDSAIAPNGALAAEVFIPSASPGLPYSQQTATVTSGTVYTWSVFLKAAGYRWIFLDAFDGNNRRSYFDLQTGTVGNTAPGNTSTITDFGNGWYRCSMTRSAGSNSVAYAVAVATSNGGISMIGDGTSGIYLWGAQLEARAFPTSYIPTTASAATRSADVASISGSNFSSWYRQDEGTVFADFRIPFASGTQRILSFQGSGGEIVNDIPLFVFSTAGKAVSGNVFSSSVNSGRIDVNENYASSISTRAAYAVKPGDRAITSKGDAVVPASTAFAMPVITTLLIGEQGGGGAVLNGTIRRLTYWPQRLSNSTLQTITQ